MALDLGEICPSESELVRRRVDLAHYALVGFLRQIGMTDKAPASQRRRITQIAESNARMRAQNISRETRTPSTASLVPQLK